MQKQAHKAYKKGDIVLVTYLMGNDTSYHYGIVLSSTNRDGIFVITHHSGQYVQPDEKFRTIYKVGRLPPARRGDLMQARDQLPPSQKWPSPVIDLAVSPDETRRFARRNLITHAEMQDYFPSAKIYFWPQRDGTVILHARHNTGRYALQEFVDYVSAMISFYEIIDLRYRSGSRQSYLQLVLRATDPVPNDKLSRFVTEYRELARYIRESAEAIAGDFESRQELMEAVYESLDMLGNKTALKYGFGTFKLAMKALENRVGDGWIYRNFPDPV